MQCSSMIPFVPGYELEPNETLIVKMQFLKEMISGKWMYTSDINAQRVGTLMNNRSDFMYQLYKNT